MGQKDSLIDYPHFNPNEKVTFPPTGPATDGRDRWNAEAKKRSRAHRYDEDYPVDPPAVDPSLTTPGGPDLYDPATTLPGYSKEQLGALNPDVELKERPDSYTRP